MCCVHINAFHILHTFQARKAFEPQNVHKYYPERARVLFQRCSHARHSCVRFSEKCPQVAPRGNNNRQKMWGRTRGDMIRGCVHAQLNKYCTPPLDRLLHAWGLCVHCVCVCVWLLLYTHPYNTGTFMNNGRGVDNFSAEPAKCDRSIAFFARSR